MKFRLTQSIGLDDARFCNKAFGAALNVDEPKSFALGAVIELSKDAADWLTGKRGLKSLLEPVESVRGQAKQPEVTAPSK